MVEQKVVIRNKAGIHCRPSGVILSEKGKYPDTTVRVISENGSTELGSILELLSLGLHCGTEITLQAEGPEEQAVLQIMSSLFAKEFDFPPK